MPSEYWVISEKTENTYLLVVLVKLCLIIFSCMVVLPYV